MTKASIAPAFINRLTHRSASIAKAGAGTALFRTLGGVTLAGGVGALIAGVVAFLTAHDRSVVTILATVTGALLSWFMVIEMFIER